MKKGILFDLDGTLWNSAPQVVEAWNRALARHPELARRITVGDMMSYMGKTLDRIAAQMLPEADEAVRLAIMEECSAEELDYLSAHPGTPFPRMAETLEALSRDYALAVVSNCQTGYIELFLNSRGPACIADHECAGRTGRPKGENIRLVMERNGIERAIYVGDTQGDLDAADLAGIPFVHAAYGFGRVDRPTPAIRGLDELPAVAAWLLGD